MELAQPILKDDQPMVLLASCMGATTGGGLFAFDGRELERLDSLSTSGITFHDGALARLLKQHDGDSFGELLLYDERGIRHYHRLDFMEDAHDVAWTGKEYLVVSTGNNTVFRVTPGGEKVGQWDLPGEGDAWHLNCLALEGDRIWLSAFGVFSNHREWSRTKGQCSGLIFDLNTREPLAGGLNAPHNPRFFDDGLGICNSASRELLHLDPSTGAVRRSLKLNAWTRGLAVSDNYLFVGESDRSALTAERTSIVVVDRKTWDILGRIHLGCDEIYDLLLVPPEIVNGARTGFHVSRLRDGEQTRRSLFQTAGVEPQASTMLPLDACRVGIRCELPRAWTANVRLKLPCMVHNKGTEVFISNEPYPVSIAYKWHGAEPNNAEVFIEGERTPLWRPLGPGQSIECQASICAPVEPGRYRLTVTLVQEQRAWFNDLDPENAVVGEVQVTV